MANENFIRNYVMKCGRMGKTGFKIGDTDPALHVSFSIEKSNAEAANTAKVQIWNLSNKNLKILEGKDCIVELKAGYANSMALILAGNITFAVTTMDGADRLTELEVVDGRVALRDTHVSISFNGAVDCKEVYQRFANQMGVSVRFAKDLSFVKLPNGFSFVGKAAAGLKKLAKCCGHSWSIQNQVLQITWPGRAISTKGYLLNSDTGLIGTPKRITISTGGDQKESMTGWEVQYLLNGAIDVNNIVKIQSSTANGYYLIHKLTIDGDNLEGDWMCTAQVLEIKAEPKKDKKASGGSGGGSGSGNSSGQLKKGDKVKVTRTTKQGSKTKGYQYSGGMFTLYYSTYDVIQVKRDRVVIGIGSTVTAAVKAADLQKV